MEQQNFKSHKVWDLPTRLFHWINVLCIIGLIAAGTVILWAKSLGIGNDGKVLMKVIHVYIGYVFAVNLTFRLIWAFKGNRFARWGSFLPFGKGYAEKLKSFMASEKSDQPQHYLGHNPLARLAITVIFLALTTMAVTGLVLAGTDIYFPPFGAMIQEWVAADGVNPADVMPYVKDNVDPVAYAEMRALRSPILDVHYWTYFIIMGLIVIHIAAVVRTEIKSGGGIISAMFTGKKILPRDPEDK